MMIPNVSEQYFQSLLIQQDARAAVSTISGFWAYRADESLPLWGLSQSEYFCQLVLISTGEIANGGLTQFVENRGTELMADHIAAMRAVLLDQFADVLVLAELTPSNATALRELDHRAWGLLDGVDRSIQRYLGKNQRSVLVGERRP
ncbi:hypothetical protein [Thalassobius sp. MITS945101]|uniref:DMP19 family protein n=1 Tax=Thalassobius sp. MITS945101 TaxID=3096994 RepID=UPI00399C011A